MKVICPKCKSNNVEAILFKDNDGLCGCLSYNQEVYSCLDCEYDFMTIYEFLTEHNIHKEFYDYVENNKEPDYNDYLREYTLSADKSVRKKRIAVSKLTDLKTLYTLRLLAPLEIQPVLSNQIQLLKQTNPVLLELEKLLYEQIPRVDKLTKSSFGYSATTSSITGLNLAERELPYFPTRITLFPNLQQLYLHGNHLTNIPDDIANLTRLKILTLHQNDLKYLPDTLPRLQNLQSFEVDSSIKANPVNQPILDKLESNGCLVIFHEQ